MNSRSIPAAVASASMSTPQPLRLKLRIYNNCLVARRETLGLSQAALAKTVGMNSSDYNALECLRESPLARKGGWTSAVQRLAEFHRCLPEDLFPDVVQAVKKNVVVRCLSPGEAARLLDQDPSMELLPSPEETLLEEEEYAALRESLTALPARMRYVLALRFGLDGGRPHTLEQVGTAMGGLSKERVRAIEAAGLRRVRGRCQQDPASRGYRPRKSVQAVYDHAAQAWLEVEEP